MLLFFLTFNCVGLRDTKFSSLISALLCLHFFPFLLSYKVEWKIISKNSPELTHENNHKITQRTAEFQSGMTWNVDSLTNVQQFEFSICKEFDTFPFKMYETVS